MIKERTEHCKIAVLGNVDSGKSTIVGVLTKGQADDGRGAARARVFNYAHEQETGRTSSICHEIMGFNHNLEQVIPERFNANKNKYWKEVVENSTKVISFSDLCGHEKYLKTTINGVAALAPDYTMIVVGANMGLPKMTMEHLGIALFLKVPFMIVMTKVDIAPANIYEQTMEKINKLLKASFVRKIAVTIKEGTPMEEIDRYADLMKAGNICPIFHASSVSMQGFKELVRFMSRLQNRDSLNQNIGAVGDPFEMDVGEVFLVEGVGHVVSGLIKAGTVKVGQHCLLGPDRNRGFKNVIIKSIHSNRTLREDATAGELACVCVRPMKANEKLNRNDFRRGMKIVDAANRPDLVWEFEAEIQVLHSSTTMKLGYQAVVHCGNVVQATNITKILTGEEVLRSSNRAVVRLRFPYNSEYIREGANIIMREGHVKALGTVTRVIKEKQMENAENGPVKSVLEKKEEREGVSRRVLRQQKWIQKKEVARKKELGDSNTESETQV